MPRPGIRVAFLSSADSYRGSAVSLQHLAHGLRERGSAVRVFTAADVVTTPLRDAGVDAVQLDLSSTSWRTARALRAALTAFGAELLIVDRPRDLRLGLLATLWSRVVLVNRYNSHASRPPRDILTRLAYRFQVRDTIFLTDEMAARILRLAPWMRRAPHRVIAEGVCLDEFRPDPDAAQAFRAEHGLGDEPFLLAVGALTREKRGDRVIEAVAGVAGAPTLVICGEGPLRDSLATQAARLGVKVRFLGLLRRQALRGAYSAAAVLVHACPVETFGLSVLEAMACGCAVVGVRGGGLREVVGEDGVAGILVSPDDVAAMTGAIERMLASHDLVAGIREAARARATSRFSVGRMSDGYAQAVMDVCRRAIDS